MSGSAGTVWKILGRGVLPLFLFMSIFFPRPKTFTHEVYYSTMIKLRILLLPLYYITNIIIIYQVTITAATTTTTTTEFILLLLL